MTQSYMERAARDRALGAGGGDFNFAGVDAGGDNPQKQHPG
jgi:hypothetical protein